MNMVGYYSLIYLITISFLEIFLLMYFFVYQNIFFKQYILNCKDKAYSKKMILFFNSKKISYLIFKNKLFIVCCLNIFLSCLVLISTPLICILNFNENDKSIWYIVIFSFAINLYFLYLPYKEILYILNCINPIIEKKELFTFFEDLKSKNSPFIHSLDKWINIKELSKINNSKLITNVIIIYHNLITFFNSKKIKSTEIIQLINNNFDECIQLKKM